MSRLSVICFAMLGAALLGCGDDEVTDPTTTIDSTDPAAQYRIDEGRPYTELLSDNLARDEVRTVRQLNGSRIDAVPAREALRPVPMGDPGP